MMPVRGRRRLPVRRRSIVVRREGEDWERDLSMCRQLVVLRGLEGKFANVEELAGRIGLNPDTVYRWLRGEGPGTDETTERILTGLEVEFKDVHRRAQARAEGSGPGMPSG
jgi:transcriptional regulator with XRE-family HTH domain